MQNRKIEFRGKNTINGNWVKGYYFVDEGIHKIHSGHTIYPVHPKTVGQNTGLKDKNGVDVFELDFCSALGKGIGVIYWCISSAMFKIKWQDELYRTVRGREGEPIFNNHELTLEIIGNTIDNPELK